MYHIISRDWFSIPNHNAWFETRAIADNNFDFFLKERKRILDRYKQKVQKGNFKRECPKCEGPMELEEAAERGSDKSTTVWVCQNPRCEFQDDDEYEPPEREPDY